MRSEGMRVRVAMGTTTWNSLGCMGAVRPACGRRGGQGEGGSDTNGAGRELGEKREGGEGTAREGGNEAGMRPR